MVNPEAPELHGHVSIEPAGEVIAASMATWRLTYTAGRSGIRGGGVLRVTSECDSDWGTPQMADPQAAEYLTIEAPEGCGISAQTRDVKTIELTVQGRPLQAGETVTITYGDRSGGGPGSRAQTFLEERHYFWVEIDDPEGGGSITLRDSPHVRVVGGDATRLVAIGPSSLAAGEQFRLHLKAEDTWGNPSNSYRGTIALACEGVDGLEDRRVELGADETGATWVEGLSAAAGVYRVEATDGAGLSATSNAIIVEARPAKYRLHWADPHGGQVALSSKIADFFRYARDISALQFVGYQRNDNTISHEDWLVQQEEERRFYDPGRFAPIPGFEWSGKTWMGGHHNVYFRRHGQQVRRSSHSGEEHPEDAGTDLPHVLDIHREYRHSDVVLTPHVGGERGDLTHHEPELEPALEMTSTHGSFEWFQREALARRYKLGFIGGSDSHTGRPGDDRPGFQLRRYAKAGLTGVYAEDVTIEAFIEAMRARRVYATTGARIAVGVWADGHPIGAEYTTASRPHIAVSVHGTGPVESVELFRGLDRVYEHRSEAGRIGNRVRVLWTGASRMTSYSGVLWDGSVRVEGAAIHAVETVRFDSPRSHLVEQTAASVRWHAWGCGYPMGLIVDLDSYSDPAQANLHLAIRSRTISGPMYGGHGEAPPRRMSWAEAEGGSLSTSLGDLESGERSLDLGVLDRRLAISLDRAPGPASVKFSYSDPDPQPGTNPYWVRVRQADMELAWTSPVFVDYAPPAI